MSQPTTHVPKPAFNTITQLLAIALLAAILVTQVMILVRMPKTVTFGDLLAAKTPEAQAQVVRGLPLVHIH